MFTPLYLHRDYRDYPTPDGRMEHATARVFLKARIVHPRTGAKTPAQYKALIDTGAERTVVPLVATEYFETQTQARLVRSTPGMLILADGTPRPGIPSFELAFEFQGLSAADPHTRSVQTVSTFGKRADGVWCSTPCFAWDYDQPVPNHRGERRRFDQVILGMDILRHWHVELNEPENRYVAFIPQNGA